MTSSKPDFDTQLIDLVRANPILYEREVRKTPYESMKKKAELWKSIATSLQVDAKTCIIRWKSLRDKFRRELDKDSTECKSDWQLLEKIRFVEQHIKYHNDRVKKQQPHTASYPWNGMNTEQLEVLEDDNDDNVPLQEAMDEQSTVATTAPMHEVMEIANRVQGNSTTTSDSRTVPKQHINRMETLLDGLSEPDRTKAAKRIIAYLCKCNLRALNNEDIDDLVL